MGGKHTRGGAVIGHAHYAHIIGAMSDSSAATQQWCPRTPRLPSCRCAGVQVTSRLQPHLFATCNPSRHIRDSVEPQCNQAGSTQQQNTQDPPTYKVDSPEHTHNLDSIENQGLLKETDFRGQTNLQAEIFTENRRCSQAHPFFLQMQADWIGPETGESGSRNRSHPEYQHLIAQAQL